MALTVLLIGYSVLAALVIALTHFRPGNYQGQRLAQVAGIALLADLAALQLAHFAYLEHGTATTDAAYYRMLLFAAAPAFYLFAKPLLRAVAGFEPRQALHLLPVAAAPWLPRETALPLAFALGAGYLLWLVRSVHALRAQRPRVRLELALLGVTFAIAVAVCGLALALPLVGATVFYALYASAIGMAFLLVSVALGLAPRLPVEVVEAARETYAVSTLAHVDCASALAKLEAAMGRERVYEDPDLDLTGLAARVDLSGHQLSELINTRLGKGFSRYLREHRVAAAQRLLLEAPGASVLSVGLSVGFTSQSNFYDAFREIAGTTPGQYRKLTARAPAHGPQRPE